MSRGRLEAWQEGMLKAGNRISVSDFHVSFNNHDHLT